MTHSKKEYGDTVSELDVEQKKFKDEYDAAKKELDDLSTEVKTTRRELKQARSNKIDVQLKEVNKAFLNRF